MVLRIAATTSRVAACDSTQLPDPRLSACTDPLLAPSIPASCSCGCSCWAATANRRRCGGNMSGTMIGTALDQLKVGGEAALWQACETAQHAIGPQEAARARSGAQGHGRLRAATAQTATVQTVWLQPMQHSCQSPEQADDWMQQPRQHRKTAASNHTHTCAMQSLSLTCAAASTSPSTLHCCSARACPNDRGRFLEGCRADTKSWLVWRWSVAQAGHSACLCSAGLLRGNPCTPGSPRCFWQWRVAQAGHSACLCGRRLLQGVPCTPGSPWQPCCCSLLPSHAGWLQLFKRLLVLEGWHCRPHMLFCRQCLLAGTALCRSGPSSTPV